MRNHWKLLLVSLVVLLLASALGKWAVFKWVLDNDDSGRKRIEKMN